MSSKKPKQRDDDIQQKQTRIAIVNQDKCKPKKCRQECKKSCPVVRMGKLCIEVSYVKLLFLCTVKEPKLKPLIKNIKL